MTSLLFLRGARVCSVSPPRRPCACICVCVASYLTDLLLLRAEVARTFGPQGLQHFARNAIEVSLAELRRELCKVVTGAVTVRMLNLRLCLCVYVWLHLGCL